MHYFNNFFEADREPTRDWEGPDPWDVTEAVSQLLSIRKPIVNMAMGTVFTYRAGDKIINQAVCYCPQPIPMASFDAFYDPDKNIIHVGKAVPSDDPEAAICGNQGYAGLTKAEQGFLVAKELYWTTQDGATELDAIAFAIAYLVSNQTPYSVADLPTLFGNKTMNIGDAALLASRVESMAAKFGLSAGQ